MANHANYSRIGFTLILAIAAISAALVYIGGAGGDEDMVWAETYSEKPVSGLSLGSAVNFRGVKVGEVKRISFVRSDYGVRGHDGSLIRIVMTLSEKFLAPREGEDAEDALADAVQHGLRATVTASGITGLSRIELDFSRQDDGTERAISWAPEFTPIRPGTSLLDNFSDSATRVMNEIDKMDFDAFRESLATIMGGAEEAVSNANNLAVIASGVLAENRAGIAETVENLKETSANLRELTETLKRDPSLLLRPHSPDPLEETR